MQVYSQYREDFGGANRIVVALTVAEGDIFTKPFFEELKAATDELFFLPGVDRARVQLDIAETLLALQRKDESWKIAREVFDTCAAAESW